MKWSLAVAIAVGASLLSTGAHADASDPYQFAVVPGGFDTALNIVRTNSTTGQSVLCATTTCLAIVDAKPVSSGSYRLVPEMTFDSSTSRKFWQVVRFDVKSGRVWQLNWDGKSTPSWLEYTFP